MAYVGKANTRKSNIFGEFADNLFNTFVDPSKDF